MRHPGLERYLLLSEASDGSILITEESRGPALLAVIRPGHRVELNEEGRVTLWDWEGNEFALDDALEEKRIRLGQNYTLDSQAPMFVSSCRHMVWGLLIPRLVVSGEDLSDWSLESSEEGLVLEGPGDRRAEVADRRWWKVIDPNYQEHHASTLLAAAGLHMGSST